MVYNWASNWAGSISDTVNTTWCFLFAIKENILYNKHPSVGDKYGYNYKKNRGK